MSPRVLLSSTEAELELVLAGHDSRRTAPRQGTAEGSGPPWQATWTITADWQYDTETEMCTPEHTRRQPFGRVPVVRHRDFWLYETMAIALYVDENFPEPALQAADPAERARLPGISN